MAAQLTATNGPDFRELWKWNDLATSSFPVPLSPWTSTVMSLSAAWVINVYTFRMGSLSPMMPSKE